MTDLAGRVEKLAHYEYVPYSGSCELRNVGTGKRESVGGYFVRLDDVRALLARVREEGKCICDPQFSATTYECPVCYPPASAGIEREAIAQILTEEYPECIKRPSDAYRGADRILDAAGTEETKAKKGELREEVGKLLLNISNCYIEWGTRDEDEKEMWREDADRVIAFLCPAPAANTEGLREALETVGDYIRTTLDTERTATCSRPMERWGAVAYRERVFKQILAALPVEGEEEMSAWKSAIVEIAAATSTRERVPRPSASNSRQIDAL